MTSEFPIATVRKSRFAPFRDKFKIDLEGGRGHRGLGRHPRLRVRAPRGDEVVGSISKHLFALSDTYGIETASGEDDGPILAVAVGSTRWPTTRTEETAEEWPYEGAFGMPPSKEVRVTKE